MTIAVLNAKPFAFFARLQHVREQISTYVAQKQVYYKAFNELNALSNRELSDIGVSRADIRDIAYEHAFGK